LRKIGSAVQVKGALPFRLTSPNAIDPVETYTAFSDCWRELDVSPRRGGCERIGPAAQTNNARGRERPLPKGSSDTAFTRPDGGSVVATSARFVGRRSAQQPLHLIIDSSTVVLPTMKWRLSALKASTSPPSLESNRSPGTQCIVGSKERLLGVAGSIVER